MNVGGVLVSHPTGTQNVRALLRALDGKGLLDAYHTTLGWTSGPRLGSFKRRHYDEVTPGRLKAHPAREIVRLASRVARLPRLTAHETGWASIDAVYRSLDRQVAHHIAAKRSSPAAVYCYDDGALDTFGAARDRGLRCVFELPTPYWRLVRRISEEEAERSPEWRSALPALAASAAKCDRKEAELAASDRVIVPSTFARASLVHSASVTIVPYGAPDPDRADGDRASTADLRVLYVGTLNQQKGLSYLLQAIGLLGRGVTLTLLGPRPATACPPLEKALKTHCWLTPRRHDHVLDAMLRHDVLVFPSLCDGFGLVMLEAMSRGLPVIATPNCAGPDIITEGSDGFVVPIRDAEAIAARLDRLATDRQVLRDMGTAARAKAAARGWSHYERRIVELATGWVTR